MHYNRGREEKKEETRLSEAHCPHASLYNERVAVTVSLSSRKSMFEHRMTLHMLLKGRGDHPHSNKFFLIIFIFIKLLNNSYEPEYYKNP